MTAKADLRFSAKTPKINAKDSLHAVPVSRCVVLIGKKR